MSEAPPPRTCSEMHININVRASLDDPAAPFLVVGPCLVSGGRSEEPTLLYAGGGVVVCAMAVSDMVSRA